MVMKMKKVLLVIIMELMLLSPAEVTNMGTMYPSFAPESQEVRLVQAKNAATDNMERSIRPSASVDVDNEPAFTKITKVSEVTESAKVAPVKKDRQLVAAPRNEIKKEIKKEEITARESANNASRHEERKTVQVFEATAYCSCVKCCGKSDGITASGVKVHPGTLAVDPKVIPFGTKVYIEGMGLFIAEDTGNFSGKRIDIYMETHEEALQFGRRKVKVVF
jgi:3D (Asp-Asp-Asp) domain-containing protein